MMESERWRRLLLDVPAGVTLPRPVDVVEISSSQRLATITTNNYQPALHMAFESIGARVQEVQRMSLEEIFVASVMRSREEVAA
jgi:ABC-2 type transport system ATP-binding protein